MRAFRFFNDLRLSEPFPSAVLLMGFLRIANSDARSSFSRQQLGRFWPVAIWLLAAVAIWLLTAGKPSATEIYFQKLLTAAVVGATMCLITRWGIYEQKRTVADVLRAPVFPGINEIPAVIDVIDGRYSSFCVSRTFFRASICAIVPQ